MNAASKVVIITGVAGFIGRYAARHFAEQGWSVIGIDSSTPENAPTANLQHYYSMRLPSPALADLLQQHQPDVCIHCAGRASVNLSVSNPSSDFYSNTALTFDLLNALREHAPGCRFIFLSSAAAYGNPEALPICESHPLHPLSPYGFHKLQSEQLCLEFHKVYDIQTASLRIFSAYAPGLRRQVVWDICRKALTQNLVVLQGSGQESRDFIHALDISRALMAVATAAKMQGEVYNLASGRETTIAELAHLVFDALDYQGELSFDGVIPKGNPLNWWADVTKLESIGFVPTVQLEQGIKVFANWCRAELVGV
jgi:UDP-glucose 4-epimerase